MLYPARNFVLRIHVKLINDKGEGRKENFHNIFTTEGKGYLQLDLQSFLTLEIRDGQWAPDKSILIDQRNIYQIIKGFEKSLDNIYNGGIFAIDGKTGETISYKDKRVENTVRIYNLGMNQRVVIEPAVIHDAQDNTNYEGVILYINKTENYVELPIDAFEALYHTIKETNLFVYSQALVNYYMTTIKGEKVEIKEVNMDNKPKPKKKHPLATSSTTEDEFTKASITPKQTSEEFFNIKKKED